MKTFLIVLFSILLLLPMLSRSQELEEEKEEPVSLGVDLVSRYLWRGLLYCNSPSIQPYVSFSKSGFTIGSWASYSALSEYAEVDLFVSFTAGPVSFSVYDYWATTTEYGDYKYFEWDKKETSHQLEASAVYTGPEGFPAVFTLATFFYGADLNASSDQNLSTYFEMAYPFKIGQNATSAFVGFTPAKGIYSEYDYSVMNIGFNTSKEIEITDKYKLPLKATFAVNPAAERVFLVVGFTF